MLLCHYTSNYYKWSKKSINRLQSIAVGCSTDLCPRPSAGFYLISPSEFERFSLSTRFVVEPRCLVEPPLHSAASQRRRQADGASSPRRHVSTAAASLPSQLPPVANLPVCPSPSRNPQQDAEDAGKAPSLAVAS